MTSRSLRGGKSTPPKSARNPNRVKTRTGSTGTQPIDELGPELRGGPTRGSRERQGGDSDPIEPIPDADDGTARPANAR